MIQKTITIFMFQILVLGFLQAQTTHEAQMADEVVESIGVNTHFYYTDTVYWTDFETLRDLLLELGIRHIRDGNAGQNTTYRERLNELAGHGIKSLLICDTRFGLADNWSQSLERLKLIMNQSNNPVELIEGPNEMDFSSNFSDLPAQTQALWNTFKGDPETSWIPILGPSLGNTASSPANLGDLSAYMDYGNLHPYPGGRPVEDGLGAGWGISLEEAIDRYTTHVSGNIPTYATETGYQMIEDGHGNLQVTERAAAKYTPRAILHYMDKGIKRFYHYQLINDHSGENFGLLNDDFSKRLQYYAIKNLITLFEDAGEDFETTPLEFLINNNASDIEFSLFQKRNGTYLLALWQPEYSCNESNDESNPPTDIEPDAIDISIDFSESKEFNIKAYTPSFESNFIEEWNQVNNITVSVPDHVVVLEISEVQITSLIDDNKIEVSFYPNPVTSTLNINLNSPTNATVKIIDSNGRNIFRESIFQEQQIPFQDFPKGLYFVNIDDGKTVITKKIIKK